MGGSGSVGTPRIDDGPFWVNSRGMEDSRSVPGEMSEEYQRYFSNNPIPMWVFDLETLKFLAVNQAAIDQYQYTREEFLSMTIEQIRPSGDVERLRRQLDQVGTREAGHDEAQHRRKDGSLINVWGIGHAATFLGRPAAFVQAMDITNRRQAEDQLQRSRALLVIAEQLAGIGSWDWEVTSGDVQWSEGMFRLFGVDPETFTPKFEKVVSMIHSEDRERFLREVEQGYRQGGDFFVDFRIQRPDGTVRFAHAHVLATQGEDGTLLRVTGVAQDVTDQHLAEAALRSEKEYSQLLVQNSVDGILAFDRQCRYTVWNMGMEHISGMSKEEVLGRSAFEVFPFLKEIGEDRYFYEALAGRTVSALDRPYVTSKGRRGVYEGYYSPLRDGAGLVIGGVAIIREVTMKKVAEEATFRLVTIVESSDDAMFGVSLNGSILTWNKGAVQLYGYAAEEMVGRPLTDLFSQSRYAEAKQLLHQASNGQGMKNYETVHARKNGSQVHVSLTLSPIEDAMGTIVGFSAVGRDITDRQKADLALRQAHMELESRVKTRTTELAETNRKLQWEIAERHRAEEALRQRERYFRSLIEDSSDVITVLNAAGIIQYMSPSIQKVLGHPQEEMAGRSVFSFLHPSDLPEVVEKFFYGVWHVGVAQRSIEFRFRHRDGRWRVLESTAKSVWDPSGALLVIVNSRDISDRQMVERRLLTQNAVTRAVAEADTPLEAAESVMREICEGLGWDLAVLWCAEEGAAGLKCSGVWRPSIKPYESFEVDCRTRIFESGDGLPGRVWAASAPLWMADVTQEVSFLRREAAARVGFRAAFGFPVTVKGRVLGVFEFFSQEVRRKDEELLLMAGAVGTQIGQLMVRRPMAECLTYREFGAYSQRDWSAQASPQ